MANAKIAVIFINICLNALNQADINNKMGCYDCDSVDIGELEELKEERPEHHRRDVEKSTVISNV